jgi:S-adenosylmethionine synthetase
VAPPSAIEVIERKGWGHPDTLADHLAERLSQVYSVFTQDEFGCVSIACLNWRATSRSSVT